MTFLELVETIMRGDGDKIVVPRGAPKTQSMIRDAVVLASMAKEYGLTAKQIVRLVDELSKTTFAPNCSAEEVAKAIRSTKKSAIPDFLRNRDAMLKFERALKEGTEINGVRVGDFISYEAPIFGGDIQTHYRIVLWKKCEGEFETLIPDATQIHCHPMEALDVLSFWYMPPKNIKVIAHFNEWYEKFGEKTEDALAYYGFAKNTYKDLLDEIYRRNQQENNS